MSVSYRCPECESQNVVCDAWAEWDEEAQQWSLSTVHGDMFCRDCEASPPGGLCRVEAPPSLQETYQAHRVEHRKATGQPEGFRGRTGQDFRK